MPATGKGFRHSHPVGVTADDVEVRNRHPSAVRREETERGVLAHRIVRRVRRERTAPDLQMTGRIAPGRTWGTFFRRATPLNEKAMEMRPCRRDKSRLANREACAPPHTVHADEIRTRPRHGGEVDLMRVLARPRRAVLRLSGIRAQTTQPRVDDPARLGIDDHKTRRRFGRLPSAERSEPTAEIGVAMCSAWRITDLVHFNERRGTVLLSHETQDVTERRGERNRVAIP